jgi:hypothetical protein
VEVCRDDWNREFLMLMILTFLICAPGQGCEPGYLAHRSCVAGQAYIRARMHPDHELRDLICQPAERK